MSTVASVYNIAPYPRVPEQVVGADGLQVVDKQRPVPEQKRVWASIEQGPKIIRRLLGVFLSLECLIVFPPTAGRVFVIDNITVAVLSFSFLDNNGSHLKSLLSRNVFQSNLIFKEQPDIIRLE